MRRIECFQPCHAMCRQAGSVRVICQNVNMKSFYKE